ncbi:DeoR/GlpR family DNA-binding transcription regulator [Streptococcus sp. E29BA]|uniref:DeoR/GlpR family DNA-binding transcription regulator n=1 Tax=Streptococcus sp. E29BA TaxID=3278716 RepID=UPI00359ED988
MLKNERLQRILEWVNKRGLITVHEIVAELDVSDMTVRRDLDELEKAGKLIRVHGGAQSIENNQNYEKSNTEKLTQQMAEKEEIADLALPLIQDNETIFFGPGTTLECLARKVLDRNLRIITNSLPVFNILMTSPTIDVILIGGKYRDITGSFIGSLANQSIKSIKCSKVFVSANAIYKDLISTYSETEGKTQQLSIDSAIDKYLLADHTKFGKYDFYPFYSTSRFDKILSDSGLPDDVKEMYSNYTEIVTPQTPTDDD